MKPYQIWCESKMKHEQQHRLTFKEFITIEEWLRFWALLGLDYMNLRYPAFQVITLISEQR